jgi:hypothetical protein
MGGEESVGVAEHVVTKESRVGEEHMKAIAVG